jgi:WD40 repeat protein
VVAISPDKSWTAASGFSGDIAVYETANLELYATKTTNKKRTKAIAFSPDGTVLASTSKGGTIQLWSFPRDQCAPQSCELDLLPVSMSHSGAWDVPIAFWPFSTSAETKIVSGTDSGMVKVWTIGSLSDANPSVSFGSVDSGAVRSLAWSPNGSMIVAGGDGDITVYDSDTLEILFQDVNAHAGRVNDVEFSPGSSMIASGGADGALKLWRFSATSEDPAPPVADGLVGSAMTLTEGEGPEDLEISFDNATCSAVNAMVVYGNIGDYNGYQGAVDSGCNIGSGPDATITHAGSNVWFSVIWVNSLNQPGHPGFSSAGARTWSATGLCGATTDDQSDGTCD